MNGPSREDVKALLVSLLPAGSDQLYDLSESAYIGGTFSGLAGALKDTLYDRIAVLRDEVNPSTVAELIPEWEQACGLAYTPIALYGTTEQRRNAVLAALRMSGGSFSLDEIRSIVQPYFLYADPSQIVILEADRLALRNAHTYLNFFGTRTAGAGFKWEGFPIDVLDGPRISAAGATVTITVTTNRLEGVEISLISPSGAKVTWPAGWLARDPTAVTLEAYRFFAPQLAGLPIKGEWNLGFVNYLDSVSLHGWGVFVEGTGVSYGGGTPPARLGEGLGAGIYNFAVVADPAKLGVGYDLVGAQRALSRWKPAHVNGRVVSILPMTSTICATPDTTTATPGLAIPC